MKIQSVKLVYFSPTGTTKAVARGIARGIDHGTVEELDITRPAARDRALEDLGERLAHCRCPGVPGKDTGTCSRMAADT